MKTIGLIGGTNWISTIEYYRMINEEVNKRKGGLDFAELLLYSFNNGEFKALIDENKWPAIAQKYGDAAHWLELAGAGCILICAATPHKIAREIRQFINVPLLHMAEVTANELVKRGIKKVGLIGTKFTMEESFFREELSVKDIDTLIPAETDRDFIQQTIFSELAKGIFSEATKKKYLQIIDKLSKQGAEAIILGCTEFPFLINQNDCPVAIINPTFLHAMAAVDFSLINASI